MKTTRKLFFSALVLFLIFITSVAYAQDLQKTFSWKYNVNKDGNIVIDNYDCNIIIHVWDKGETEYHLMVDARTRSEEDAAVLDQYLQNLKFANTASSVTFKSGFWETRNSIMGRMTMKLEGGKTISLTDFSMKAELWIPSGCRFDLRSKYSELNMEDFPGQLNLNLYNDNFYGSDLKGKARIADKYSTIVFNDMKDIDANLYNSKLEAKSMDNLKIESKYSRVNSETAGILSIDSYNDKYSFTRTGDITFVAKYSDLKTEFSGHVNLDCYEGSINLKEAKDIKLTTKYADFQFGNVGDVYITSSYNDKLVFDKLNAMRIDDSKYCTYKFGVVMNSVVESSGYEDKFTILKTGQDFDKMSIDGKYTEISLSLAKTIDYRFKAKIDYAKLDMNESQLKSKSKILEGSNLQYDAVKGTEKEGMPVIEINGYQMALKIIEL